MRRVRRALLFTPGDEMHKIEKAAKLNVDSLIMDLEDGVALNRKAEARRTVATALRTLGFGQTERLVRLNPAGSPWQGDDLSATIDARPDGYVLPKVESPEEVRVLSTTIAAAERARGWPEGSIRLLVMIETALGVLQLRQIAAADPRLEALIFGAEDLAGDLGATRTPEGWEIFYARSAVVVAAAAYGLQAIDMIFAHLTDLDGLSRETRQAAQMGYSGKTVIHPRQIEPVQAVFTPSSEEIERAQRLIEAYAEFQAGGTGAFAWEGKMVDAPMIRAAEQTLARARAAGLFEG
ncbi:MAG: CoA ester lyase [Ardenticatenaceae bacterium]|nr:CoA ester lyase [Ardenticatenaceae bacterium]HBY95080.1 hypothetical protein [Chloroflexota bacterium]